MYIYIYIYGGCVREKNHNFKQNSPHIWLKKPLKHIVNELYTYFIKMLMSEIKINMYTVYKISFFILQYVSWHYISIKSIFRLDRNKFIGKQNCNFILIIVFAKHKKRIVVSFKQKFYYVRKIFSDNSYSNLQWILWKCWCWKLK